MTTTEIREHLEPLLYKNAVLKYEDKLYQVERWKLNFDKLVIVATPKSIVVSISKISEFLNEVEFVSSTMVFKAQGSHDLERDDFGYNKLNKGLLQAFEKVQEDPEFIPKAKQMCEIVRELVHLEKTKLEILKMTGNGKRF